jgi:tetratricopeptide (TPR) repeat protein
MVLTKIKAFARRPAVVIAGLTLIAVLGFVFVNHLVTRFGEQQKALARRLFKQGQADVNAKNPERAVDNFRGALTYDRGNEQYQLSLARALRDTGRTSESRAYLLSLWERKPEDSTTNLALARLAVRENSVEDALRYYHNASYGVWPADGDARRRDAQFELIDFLLKSHAVPQAQAELITMTPALPANPDYHLRLATLFARAQDNEHALAQFQQVIHLDSENAAAHAGAGEAAFQLNRYRTAQTNLAFAAKANASDAATRLRLQQTELILQSDPYARRLSNAERERRVHAAFDQSGKRLNACLASSPPPAADLAALKTRWQEMKSKLVKRHEMEMHDSVMDLVSQIEQATATQCGPPTGLDNVLLVLSQDREGTEQ